MSPVTVEQSRDLKAGSIADEQLRATREELRRVDERIASLQVLRTAILADEARILATLDGIVTRIRTAP